MADAPKYPTPLVGHVVHFYHRTANELVGPLAALVTRIDGTATASMVVTKPDGRTFFQQKVLHRDAAASVDDYPPAYWEVIPNA